MGCVTLTWRRNDDIGMLSQPKKRLLSAWIDFQWSETVVHSAGSF